MLAKHIKFQEVQCDMSKRSQWQIDLNGGTTPILEFPNGTLIYESKVIMEWAHE